MQISRLQAHDLRLEPLLAEIDQGLEDSIFSRTSTMQNLRDLLESHQGLVIADQTTVYAFLIYHLKEPICQIDFAYATYEKPSKALLGHLISGLLQLCRGDEQIHMVRCDFIPWFGSSLQNALIAQGFQHSPRLLLRADVPFRFAEETHSEIQLFPWQDSFTKSASRMLMDLFRSSEESKWDPSIRHITGCQRFLAETYAGRFGIFDPSISTLLKFRNHQAGLALCSWGEEGQGFISAFGILPEFSGLGLGGKLLRHVMRAFEAMQAPAVELAVSEANLPARRLYTAQQFEVKDQASLYYYPLRSL